LPIAFSKIFPIARNIIIDPATLRIHVNILRGSSGDRPIDINNVNSENCNTSSMLV